MYIITDKTSNTIHTIGHTLERWSNGYPIVDGVAFPSNMVHEYEVSEIPSGVEPMKYCYTAEDGFYLNENYREPSAYDLAPTDVVNAIIDEYTNELIESGVL